MAILSGIPRLSVASLQGRLVGAFVCGQLLFLACANVLPLLPQRHAERGELTDDITWQGRTYESDWLQVPLETVAGAARRYGEATGQMQNWSLFAPGIAPQATFPVVELQWNTQPTRSVQLRSEFEPADPRHYISLPITNSRLFNYEFRMTHPLWFCTDESLATMPEVWEQWIATRTARQRQSLQAYVQWKTNSYLAEHLEEEQPDCAVLLVRCYPIARLGETEATSEAVKDRPLIRLQADKPLEYFNPVKKQFLPVTDLPVAMEVVHGH